MLFIVLVIKLMCQEIGLKHDCYLNILIVNVGYITMELLQRNEDYWKYKNSESFKWIYYMLHFLCYALVDLNWIEYYSGDYWNIMFVVLELSWMSILIDFECESVRLDVLIKLFNFEEKFFGGNCLWNDRSLVDKKCINLNELFCELMIDLYIPKFQNLKKISKFQSFKIELYIPKFSRVQYLNWFFFYYWRLKLC